MRPETTSIDAKTSPNSHLLRKKPTNPRKVEEWKAGTWPGAPAAKVKYKYCVTGRENLANIARTLAGKPTGDPKYKNYLGSLTWRDIARFNFATDVPSEINWYLVNFNGCALRTADGGNCLLDIGDKEPWLWIPCVGLNPPAPASAPKNNIPQICLPAPPSDYVKAMLDVFDFVDQDQDGFLQKSELYRGIGSPLMSGLYSVAIATTLEKYWGLVFEAKDMLGLKINGVSRADLRAFDARLAKNPNDGFVTRVLSYYSDFQNKLCRADHDLFVGLPDPLSVCQGFVGDCWLLAALVGLAQRDPSAISKMITPVGSGGLQFDVKFPGEKSSVSVRRPTDGEILMLGATHGNGLWLSVLEKAWGQIVYNEPIGWALNDSPVDAADSGRLVGRGIELATGHKVDFALIPLQSPGTLRYKLQDALKNGKIVTAGIINVPVVDTWKGWPDAHAYTVMGYDPAKDTIQVRNPWGESGPAGKTLQRIPYTMSLIEFMGVFSDLAFEQ